MKSSHTSTKASSSALPAGCDDYKVLTNPKRKIATLMTPSREDDCDTLLGRYPRRSPDWQGAGWYRISPSIGTKIPTSPTKFRHCGTSVTGWISGSSTPGIGNTIDAKVCFVWYGNDCQWNMKIKVKNCKDFLLYYLPDTRSCNWGYCVE